MKKMKFYFTVNQSVTNEAKNNYLKTLFSPLYFRSFFGNQ